MADRREQTEDMGILLRAALQGDRAGIWTALPGYVLSFDAVEMTCSVQPTIQGRFGDETGAERWLTMPPLLDCPVVFPNAGGFALTFPVRAGDEVLVVFSSRCIDSWWNSSGVQVQAELRMHDLSDGFAIPGPRSRPRALPGVSADDVQLRTDDGEAFVSISPGYDVSVQTPAGAIVRAGAATVTATNITLNGDVRINGSVDLRGALVSNGAAVFAGEVTANGVKVSHHQHGGVQNGGSRTGGPENYP